jgi:glycerate dehydrogenase
MKIVVLDGYTENPGDLSWKGLEQFGELTVYDRTSLTDEAEAIARIGGAEAVFTNKTPITRRVMDACPKMRFISMLATGYNVVDVAYAREKGIPVTNVPTYGTNSVSQFAIALLLEICHHVGHHDQTVHQGKWEHCQDWCYWDYPLIELAGKTMGIIGCGKIGQSTRRPSPGRWACTCRLTTPIPRRPGAGWRSMWSSTRCWPPPTSSPCTCR